ncbi:MAG: universal stress protein [Desulfobacterales bacterium]|nr:universal stress protein [Desulfobacterales bacterium]
MYSKILVPLDGSPRAQRILSHVEDIARFHKSKVILLRVLRSVVVSDGYKQVLLEETKQEQRRRIEKEQRYLNGVKGEFREKGIQATTVLETGPVVRTIIAVSQREDVDLIALASHGRAGLAQVFFGSTAAGVLNQADRPLLLIRSRDG